MGLKIQKRGFEELKYLKPICLNRNFNFHCLTFGILIFFFLNLRIFFSISTSISKNYIKI